MRIRVELEQCYYIADLTKAVDLSIRLGQVRCFGANEYRARPYQNGDFVGAVSAGAPVNFFELELNPHGHGTHTECLGHITEAQQSVLDCMEDSLMPAKLISVSLEERSGDQVICAKALQDILSVHDTPPALIIRTLPNAAEKLTKDYSSTNPPYFSEAAMRFLVDIGVEHLIVDLPSVDREQDDGILAAHHVFWGLDEESEDLDSRRTCTITELIFVPDSVEDGLYLLDLQLAPIELDAVPSRPIIYPLTLSQS